MSENPLWVSIAEFSARVPLLFVSFTSSLIVLTVVAINSNLHQSPGILMAILSIIDLVIILGDSTIVTVQVGRQAVGSEVFGGNFMCLVSQFNFT